MRPRALKRRLVLAGLGGMLAAATVTAGVAKATPDVCAALQASPTVGTVEQLVVELVSEGLTPGDSGEVIAVSVIGSCPQYKPVLQRFIQTYAPTLKGQRV